MDAIKPDFLKNIINKTESEKEDIENMLRRLFPYIDLTIKIRSGKIKAIAYEGEIIFKKEKENGKGK